MAYDFDKEIDRRGTHTIKWDDCKTVFGREDIIPLSIADMDIPIFEGITEAMVERTKHPVYGYNVDGEELYSPVAQWCKKRHGWAADWKHMLVLPGVVTGICLAVEALTEPGDGIIVQTPVYPPFLEVINMTKRTLVENPLIEKGCHYTMDFDDLEKKAQDSKNTMIILCSPHNPVGRVWKKEELQKVHEICLKNNVKVICDEIHGDIIFSGHKHMPFATLGEDAKQNVVTMMSVSKTFNLAGLNTAFMIVDNDEWRSKIDFELQKLHMWRSNIMGAEAAITAYTKGEAWVDEMLVYMEKNADYCVEFVEKNMPNVHCEKPEGTYLIWMDFRHYFKTDKELEDFLFNTAKVGLNLGLPYGKPGEGWARLNFGIPRPALERAMETLAEAVKQL